MTQVATAHTQAPESSDAYPLLTPGNVEKIRDLQAKRTAGTKWTEAEAEFYQEFHDQQSAQKNRAEALRMKAYNRIACRLGADDDVAGQIADTLYTALTKSVVVPTKVKAGDSMIRTKAAMDRHLIEVRKGIEALLEKHLDDAIGIVRELHAASEGIIGTPLMARHAILTGVVLNKKTAKSEEQSNTRADAKAGR